MKTECDICTKEKRISYSEFVDDILIDKLGMSITNSGTKYLRELIIYIYLKDPFEIFVDKEIKSFLKDNNINKNFNTIKNKIKYAIDYANIEKIKNNFYVVFKVEYNPYFLTTKHIVEIVINLMNYNF